MAANAAKGDRIVIDSAKAGDPARQGTIVETIEREYGTSYRVSWDDGHESTVRPSAGTARITPARKATGDPAAERQSASRKPSGGGAGGAAAGKRRSRSAKG